MICKMNRKEKQKWYKKEFEEINQVIKNKNSLSYLDFLRIRNFKLQNSSVEDKEHIKEVTQEAFKLATGDKIEEAIEKLLELNGVAVPIASTILAMKFPNKFAIIDRIVLTNLGKNDWLKRYTTDPKIYLEYLSLIRKKAKEKGLDLRDYERRLFED